MQFFLILQSPHPHNYQSGHHICVILYLYSNMTSYLADIRNQIYFDFKAWPNIFDCFEYYAARELSGKN